MAIVHRQKAFAEGSSLVRFAVLESNDDPRHGYLVQTRHQYDHHGTYFANYDPERNFHHGL